MNKPENQMSFDWWEKASYVYAHANESLGI